MALACRCAVQQANNNVEYVPAANPRWLGACRRATMRERFDALKAVVPLRAGATRHTTQGLLDSATNEIRVNIKAVGIGIGGIGIGPIPVVSVSVQRGIGAFFTDTSCWLLLLLNLVN